MGRKTRIDWADASWNPVTGCKHGCEYCYARGIARRFGNHLKEFRAALPDGISEEVNIHVLDNPLEFRESRFVDGVHAELGSDGKPCLYPFDFEPTFHKYRLKIPQTWKAPKNIFVCSMADLFGEWVPDEWIDHVLTACLAAPQHRYLFLTKNPERYIQLERDGILVDRDNFWYGYTATRNSEIWHFTHADDCPVNHLFVSIEPILEPINPGFCSHVPAEWVIIGAETGNRKGKVIPNPDWIREIRDECEMMGIPVFMKESLRGIMGADFIQEFPWEAV